MNIKNYTSSVAVSVTVARIEQMVADAGATGIRKEYVNAQPVSLIFEISFAEDRPVLVRLPANVESCLEAFWQDYRKNRGPRSNKAREEFREQAAKTAWKIQQDWVEVQLSLIRLKQQEFLQAFLPYVWDGSQTFYERLRGAGFKALLPPPNAQGSATGKKIEEGNHE